jgi:hypothetical protein
MGSIEEINGPSSGGLREAGYNFYSGPRQFLRRTQKE